MITLPDGSTVAISATFDAAVTISALSNADPALATSTAHGLADGDVGILYSGWEAADSRAFRVDDAATNAFDVEGLDTTNTTLFPAGLGVGTFKAVASWTTIDQILDVSLEGGEQQAWQYRTLDSRRQREIPTFTDAERITMTLGDDITKAWFETLSDAARLTDDRVLRITSPDGRVDYYACTVGFRKTPSLTIGEGKAVQATFSLKGEVTRYAA